MFETTKRDTGDDSLYANILDAALTLDEYERKKLATVIIASTLSELSRKDVCADINYIDFV